MDVRTGIDKDTDEDMGVDMIKGQELVLSCFYIK
jgi:hypothetical protein